ncbi:hypothetical protein HYPSUDRAFT_200244 [Hypholoma sublateritium FD-334 SS-4]|uniref:Palmitoyltransferase n=1 Tax=Hypholoma sublateritium (strain FD-334 SS-4) TaxID=945553 RepID=A0A0D2MM41_HYPSF|nr:hypothetical protein HYPSUDRAFT_200244 [Hypholoma sublateritium FD-334 SS-4]
MAAQPPSATIFKQQREETCCGVIREASEVARDKRYNRTTPQPWLARKLLIGITLGIMGFSAYVYVQRLCLPMIRRQRRAQADRNTGIALLVVFCVIFLWMLWAYIRIILTPPGYAKDHVKQSERPLILAAAPLRESWQSSNILDSSVQDVEVGNRDSQQSRGPSLTMTTSRGHASQRHPSGLAGPSYEDLLRRDESRRSGAQERNTGTLDAISVPKTAAIATPISTSTTLGAPAPPKNILNSKLSKKGGSEGGVTKHGRAQSREQRLMELHIARRPPSTPVLDPVHRYCTVDQIVKPYRSHHCRICGTCVLKYDHHCPWIGQCVGARNHKFFINFNQATVVFTSYTFGTLLAYTIKSSDSPLVDIDPQEIVVIALAGFFLLFTFLLVLSHVGLILRGLSTVESLQVRNMKERESMMLAKGFKWWEFGAKKQTIQEWNQEWGTLDREGNIWWLGNTHEEWTSVMGSSWIGWILPVGRSDNDGLSYPFNPRFDSNGRWRRRAEWPPELR